MKLYKYMSVEAGKAFLQNPALPLTPPILLNDPFELKVPPYFKGELTSYDEAFEELSHSVGVVSLTSDPKNLLMWAHYGEQHKGLVVELDVDDDDPYSLFDFSPQAEALKHFEKVIYSDIRKPKIDFVNTQQTPALRMQAIAKVLFDAHAFSKSSHWQYENEYRYIFQPQFGMQVRNQHYQPISGDALLSPLGFELDDMFAAWQFDPKSFTASHSHFRVLIPLNIDAISAIYFGVNTSEALLASVMGAAQENKKIEHRVLQDGDPSQQHFWLPYLQALASNPALLERMTTSDSQGRIWLKDCHAFEIDSTTYTMTAKPIFNFPA